MAIRYIFHFSQPYVTPRPSVENLGDGWQRNNTRILYGSNGIEDVTYEEITE